MDPPGAGPGLKAKVPSVLSAFLCCVLTAKHWHWLEPKSLGFGFEPVRDHCPCWRVKKAKDAHGSAGGCCAASLGGWGWSRDESKAIDPPAAGPEVIPHLVLAFLLRLSFLSDGAQS